MNIYELKVVIHHLYDLREKGILDNQQCLSFMHRAVSLYGKELNKVNSESSDPVFPDV